MPDLDNPEATEKIKDFMQEVVSFANGKSKYTDVDELATQALVILSIEGLCIENAAYEKIKHLLTESQIKDINTLINKNNAMKARLYSQVDPM